MIALYREAPGHARKEVADLRKAVAIERAEIADDTHDVHAAQREYDRAARNKQAKVGRLENVSPCCCTAPALGFLADG